MSRTLAPLPPDFSWLQPADRPSSQEVDAYTHFIADHESAAVSALTDITRRRDEAELQLWLWNHEKHETTPEARVTAASG